MAATYDDPLVTIEGGVLTIRRYFFSRALEHGPATTRRRPLPLDVSGPMLAAVASDGHPATGDSEAPGRARTVEPLLVDYGNGHLAACHHPLNVASAAAAA